MNLYAVIMAGGRGERFWPMGRKNMPKQLLKLTGTSTMIEETVLRLFPLIAPENVLVITNKDYVDQVREVLPIPEENVIGEPESRDTAACVALAAAIIRRRDKSQDATMILLPADHVIKPAKALQKVLADSAQVAQSGMLLTIGIVPTEPATGYGYIHCGSAIDEPFGTKFFSVLGFREKPDAVTAKRFLSTGNFKWNSGMFIWKVDSILSEFSKYTPKIREMADNIIDVDEANLQKCIEKEFAKCEKISIDYAVMESSSNIAVAESNFDWDDIGSWTAMRRQFASDAEGNVFRGLAVMKDSHNCIVMADENQLVGVIGMKDVVVVHAGNATLVCPTEEVQRVRELVRILEERRLEEYY